MNKKTVSILIPAYNEEANIGFLIEDLEKQNTTDFVLEKILINCDGCTDKTAEIVQAKNNPYIELIENKMTKGQAFRQNELMALSTSDIAVILNADIQITDKNMLAKLIKPVSEGKADLTSCVIKELAPHTFVENCIHLSMQIKNAIFAKYNNGDNVYTCHGLARALSKDLYKNIQFNTSEGEDAYTYFYCKTKNYEYVFVPNTFVAYRVSANLNDYSKQNMRFSNSKKLLAQDFGQEVVERGYRLPLPTIIQTALPNIIRHPILALGYFGMYVANVVKAKFKETPPTWAQAASSKLVRKNL